MQLIYGGKTSKSLPRFQFPDDFSLSVNKTHYSNEKEACKLIEEILVPYIAKIRDEENLANDQKALVIMDVFTGQMTATVLDLFREHNIEISCVPANMTHIFQPLDLTVNGFAKKFMKKKFNDWYSTQITMQLDEGKLFHDIDIPLKLSILKPLHAQWLVDLFNQMTKSDGRNTIISGWKASGITGAVEKGLVGLDCLDPFNDIDPMLDFTVNNDGVRGITTLSEEELGIRYSKKTNDDDDDSDSEWECEEMERNAFDAFIIDEDDD